MEDIDKILSLEIKKEIADRYFGFRKLIEDNIRDYDQQVLRSFSLLEKKIGLDLIRLYILLKDEGLIHDFFREAGLEHLLFYDPYIVSSPTIRQQVFAGLEAHGLTAHSRFKHMIFDLYEELESHINQYRERMQNLAEEHDVIAEEIKLFYKKNDLGTIMDFMRNIDGIGSYKAGSMEGGLTPRTGQNLEKKMRVTPPSPVEELLPIIPPIKPLSEVKGRLKPIIEKAWKLQKGLDLRTLTRKQQDA